VVGEEETVDMIYACYVLFGLAIVSYVLALLNINADAGEMYSDIGNALMLTTAVLLLFRAARGGRNS
jgi:hypothetical protein